MRKWMLLAVLMAATLSIGLLGTPRAEAMTLGAPAGLGIAANAADLSQDVAVVCRRAWRCGPYGCGWRRACVQTGPRYYGGYGYRGYRGGYGYRGYRGGYYRGYGYRRW